MPELDLRLDLDAAPGARLHVRLENALREAIRAGALRQGARLPSSRDLAAQLDVSRGVVVEAYEQLTAEGYLAARVGAGTTVTAGAQSNGTPPRPAGGPPEAPRHDFHPGHPDLSRFPLAAWLSAMRAGMRRQPFAAAGYGDVRGLATLREALADYLGRVRATVADPERTLVTTGQTQGFVLVLRALAARGARRVALEDPGFLVHRACVAHVGLEPVPLPVDDEGARVDLLDAARADAVVLTPAHQHPTGAVLSASRRQALLRWSGAGERWIVEDDYDAEFRYDREPLGALQGLAPERVVYSGSASKTLAPGLRLGWLHLPDGLVEGVCAEKMLADMGSSAPEQAALAEFLAGGRLDRHLRRMRPLYAERRAALACALAEHLPEARLLGVPAGLHAAVVLGEDLDEAALLRAALGEGIALQGLRPSYFSPEAAPAGLLLGFANQTPEALWRGIGEIARLMP